MAISDREFRRLILQLRDRWIERAVRTLLAGNDTQSFTTAQYEEMYIRHENKRLNLADVHKLVNVYKRMLGEQWGRAHLTTNRISRLIQEVKPNVWAWRAVIPPPVPERTVEDFSTT